jgi:hypothetical protein
MVFEGASIIEINFFLSISDFGALEKHDQCGQFPQFTPHCGGRGPGYARSNDSKLIQKLIQSLFAVSDMPKTLGLTIMFADDLSTAASALDMKEIEAVLNKDMKIISGWAKKKKLRISPEKSTLTFFTSYRKEHNVHPQIFFEGALITPSKKNQNLLESTLTNTTASTHTSNTTCLESLSGVRLSRP